MTRFYVALYDSSTDETEGSARRILDGTEEDEDLRQRWPEILGWLEEDSRRYAVVRTQDELRRSKSPLGTFGAQGVHW